MDAGARVTGLPAERRAGGGAARRRVRRVLVAAGAVVVVVFLAFAVLWLVTPSASDARQRAAAHLQSVGAPGLDPLPNPDRVGIAVVATEDHRFYSHHGVDPLAFVHVATDWVLRRGDQGGATIDQQLAKLLYTPTSSGITTEIEQVMLALKLDRSYSKTEILQLYLDSAYYGNGFYGIDAASQGYFGLPPDKLSWGQASLLAGLLQAPSAYDPLTHLDLAVSREQHVLDRLVATNQLTPAQASAAAAASLGLVTAG